MAVHDHSGEEATIAKPVLVFPTKYNMKMMYTSLVLTLVRCMTLCVPVFAAEPTENSQTYYMDNGVKVTIGNRAFLKLTFIISY